MARAPNPLLPEPLEDDLAVEGLVYVQNTRIGFTLGQVRGVVIAAAAARGLPVYEYAPRKVKQSVTGLGGAGKTQVAHTIKITLGLKELPAPDAADALAIALCHLHRAPLAHRVARALAAAGRA